MKTNSSASIGIWPPLQYLRF